MRTARGNGAETSKRGCSLCYGLCYGPAPTEREKLMTPEEQKALTKSICQHAAEFVIGQIERGKVPESWDGIELREYLSDRIKWHNMEKRRKREYNNTIMVNGL